MNILKFATSAIVFVLSTSTHAALVEHLGGRPDYNNVADLTWPADTSHKKIRGYGNDDHANRDATNSRALQRDVAGVTGWRLADPDSPCTNAYCSKREAGSLFHNVSGGRRDTLSHSTNYDLFNHKDSHYWSDSGHTNKPDYTHYSEYYRGSRDHNGKTHHLGRCEVSAVPVPAAAWLFGSGLIGLIGVARRKAHA